MRKRILITGAGGFLGRSLRDYCYREHPQVECYGLDVCRGFVGKNMLRCDLKDKGKLKRILAKVRPHYIFHFAGGRIKDHSHLFDANIHGILSLLEAVRQQEGAKPRIIIPSTAAEYGRMPTERHVFRETDLPQPVSWYGFVKCMQTSLAFLYSHKKVDVVIARMFNILGEGTPDVLAIGRFAGLIADIEAGKKTKILKTGNLSGKRDFLDIDDVCSALWAVAQKGKRGDVYNVCSGRSYAMRDLVRKLLVLSARKGIVLKEDRAHFAESQDTVGANGKLRKQTGWKPRVTIEKSLRDTLEYYRKEKKKSR